MKLYEWQCINPRYWSEEDCGNYLQDTLKNLTIGMVPVVQILSPRGAADILLAVLVKIAMDSPAYIPTIVDMMADAASFLEKHAPHQGSRRVH